jgi:hypothetical protein
LCRGERKKRKRKGKGQESIPDWCVTPPILMINYSHHI